MVGAQGYILKANSVHAHELAAQELAKTGGSLSSAAHGRLICISAGPNEWNVGTPWKGKEIGSWNQWRSNWDKMITVAFYAEAGTIKLPTFTLALDPETPPEEVARAAETYMMLLNLARVE